MSRTSVCVVQCRKYKGSEKVRRRADVIYHKFKKLFTVKDGDDFTKVFVTSVLSAFIDISFSRACFTVECELWPYDATYC